jgi:hypothetical protein
MTPGSSKFLRYISVAGKNLAFEGLGLILGNELGLGKKQA